MSNLCRLLQQTLIGSVLAVLACAATAEPMVRIQSSVLVDTPRQAISIFLDGATNSDVALQFDVTAANHPAAFSQDGASRVEAGAAIDASRVHFLQYASNVVRIVIDPTVNKSPLPNGEIAKLFIVSSMIAEDVDATGNLRLEIGNARLANLVSQNVTPILRNGLVASATTTTRDTDGDGIPDLTEIANGLDPQSNADAALDSDGDGLSNSLEYISGSNPWIAEEYDLVEIGQINNATMMQPTAIDAQSRVVGYACSPCDQMTGFAWDETNGLFILNNNVAGISGGHVSPRDIVDGKVVGYAGGGNNFQTFTWDYRAASATVPSTSIWVNGAYAVNASNEFAGLYYPEPTMTLPLDQSVRTAFYRDAAGNFTYLGTLGGPTSTAYALNNAGVVVGEATNADGQARAFVWTKAQGLQSLGTLGGAHSRARSVNNKDIVVGQANDPQNFSHAMKWTATGGMESLGHLLGGWFSEALRINDNNQVVGAANVGSGSLHAFISAGGEMVDLNSIVRFASPWRLAAATAINNPGRIVGYGKKIVGTAETAEMYGFMLKPRAVDTIIDTPVITPTAVSQIDFVQVSISTTTRNAKIFYTTDGSTPTASSTLYTVPFFLLDTTTLKVVGQRPGFTDSAIVTQQYNISIQNADNDGDGMSDRWEVTNFQSLTHDGLADTDLDGIQDRFEFQLGKNPNAPDNTGGLIPGTQLAYAYQYANAVNEKYVTGTATDASGNVYLTGYFRGQVDFDPVGTDIRGSTAVEDNFLFVSKINADGTYGWTWTAVSNAWVWSMGIAVDESGNAYITGGLTGIVTFAPGVVVDATDAWYGRGFVARINAGGTHGWTQSFAGQNLGSAFGYSVAADRTGHVYLAGSFINTVDFNPTAAVEQHLSDGWWGAYLVKYNTDGTYQWSRTVPNPAGNSSLIEGYAVTANATSVYLGGEFAGTADFDRSITGDELTNAKDNVANWYEYMDGYVAQYDTSGNFQRAWQIAGQGAQVRSPVQTLAAAGSGELYVGGYFSGSADFDPSSGTANRTSAGSNDAYLLKLDNTGALAWANTFGGADNDVIREIALGDNHVYVGGMFANVVDFNPGGGVDQRISNFVNGVGGPFAAKYSLNGAYVGSWTPTGAGNGDVDGLAIYFDAATGGDTVYIANSLYGALDYNPTRTPVLMSSTTVNLVAKTDFTLTKFVWANLAPTVPGATFERAFGQTVAGFLNATDADNDLLIFSVTTTGMLGTLVLSDSTTGAFTYTAPNVVGWDQFTYTVTDVYGASASGLVRVRVYDPNDIDSDGLLDSWEQSNFGSLDSGAGDDPDGDGLTNAQEAELGLGGSLINQTGTGVFHQSAAGLVSIEAENFHNVRWRNGRTWSVVSQTGASGGALQALPDTGGSYDTSYTTSAPSLDYDVNFTKTGTHYVWVRGLAVNTGADSVHVGLNGAANTSSQNINGYAVDAWSWKGASGSTRSTINIATAGVYTVNLWMCEDGFIADKIVITTDVNFVPADSGPAASVEAELVSGSLGNIAPSAVVTASSENIGTNQHATKAVDEIVDGSPGDATKEWATVNGVAGSWIQLNWSEPYLIDRIALFDRRNSNDQVTTGTLSFGDGTFIGTGILHNGSGAVEYNFAPRFVTWVRYTVDTVSATTTAIGLAEMKVYGKAQAVKPQIAPVGKLFSGSISVAITAPGAQVYYTLDGTEPTRASILYDGTPLVLTTTTTVRARSFRQGYLDSELSAETFVETAQAPIESFVVDTFGRIVIESEHPDLNQTASGITWAEFSSQNFSNGIAMRPGLSDLKVEIDLANATQISPRLSYRFYVEQAGIYYFWSRGQGTNNGNDDTHVGLDGQPLFTIEHTSGDGIKWRSLINGGGIATIDIVTPGLHTLDVWMNEDTAYIDKLLLTTDSNFGFSNPATATPPESPRALR